MDILPACVISPLVYLASGGQGEQAVGTLELELEMSHHIVLEIESLSCKNNQGF